MSGLVNHFHRSAAAAGGAPGAPRASPQSLSNVLYSLARMGYRLNEQGMAILAGLVTQRLEEWDAEGAAAREGPGAGGGRHAVRSPAPPPFSAQELSNVLWALATLGHAPEPRLGELLLAATQATVRVGVDGRVRWGTLTAFCEARRAPGWRGAATQAVVRVGAGRMGWGRWWSQG